MPEHHHQLYLTDILDSGRAIQSYEAIAKLVIPAKAGIQCFCNILKFLDSGFRRNDGFLPFWTFATASYVQDIAFEQFIVERMRCAAVIREFEIIGKAVGKLPETIKSSKMKWSLILG
ncbi:MAG: ribonuclease HepT family protein [Sulfuricella sp.]|nr:hypothetical protein [Gammaproteobacteria bacterium]